MKINKNSYFSYHRNWVSSLLFLIFISSIGQAADNNTTRYRPDGNWDVQGANGQLYVFGSLTESACRIAMESTYQSVDMGNIETADLQQVGQKGKPVPFHIELLDCIETVTALRDLKTGSVAWSSSQPGIKVRFLASSVPGSPDLIDVSGVEGVALQLSDNDGRAIPIGETSFPQLLSPGQDNLTYFLTPVRIADKLQAGAYRSLVSFELIYD